MHELTEDGLFDGPKLLRRLLLKYLFGFGVAKRLNHELIVYRYSVNCKANDSSLNRLVRTGKRPGSPLPGSGLPGRLPVRTNLLRLESFALQFTEYRYTISS